MLNNLKDRKAKYYLNSSGEFVIDNYNSSKPFANFFPGIAGKYGIPMWVFYVNRGQAIVSFGTKDKDHAIAEFFPANKAWQLVSRQGFRTFIKEFSGKKTLLYEPFHNDSINLGYDLINQMRITSFDLKIKEDNLSLGLGVEVEYFTIPNDIYAALVRIVTIKNTGSATKKIQLIDGLPQIVPYGVSNLFLKKLGRTIEAWMNVENLERGIPFYKLDVDPTDRPEVFHIKEGNFYLGFHCEKSAPHIIKPTVDPQSIFGSVTDFSYPLQFMSSRNFPYPKREITKNKTPSGMLLLTFELDKNSSKEIYSLIGHMRSKDLLNSCIGRITHLEYLNQKREENKRIIQGLQEDIATVNSSREFSLYAKQTYLDNIIRGGYPIVFSGASNSVFYLYSRKHGDLERDYNKFQIQPTYFSQGNGNYRDMNQNRRSDVWFNPQIQDENVITFFNLLQTDGFNPLVVKGVSFSLKNSMDLKTILDKFINEKDIAELTSFLNKPFTPGEIILFIEENKINLKLSCDEFMNTLISYCQKNEEAEHGEGFWTDHWTYNLDLLESYLGIYPEQLKEIVFEKKAFHFYDNTEIVKQRCEKYILKDGEVRQLHATSPSNTKREMIKKRTGHPHVVRMQYGKGEIYQTTLINKLFCLVVNKLASQDPFGVGIEMEADKPNWFDALNGLPALLGSSLCETLELKRLVLFIKEAIYKTGVEKIYLAEETHNFLIELGKLVGKYLNNNSCDKDFRYWDKSYCLKEDYRKKTMLGFSGQELEILASNLAPILNDVIKKLDLGIARALNKKKGIYYAYFVNEAIEFQPLKAPFVKPTKFVQKKLPLFLESQMHALRLTKNTRKAKALYAAVKKSELYDKKLKMYKVTASLKSEPFEIGRCRVFTPGWLEHESVWLHMEYKYLLEILKSGLYAEFYRDFKDALVPFQKPEKYGRSILENSSFIVSSAFPDKNLHGNGFVARLSGSTAEFLQIWLIMNLGKKPFFLNDKNELNLQFKPILAGWLFTPLDKSDKSNKNYLTGLGQKDKTYGFKFLSKIWVVYHNPKRKNTFGKNGSRPKRIIFKDKDGNPVELNSPVIPSPYAAQIRARQIDRIDVYFQ